MTGAAFARIFGSRPQATEAVPGRVNLIGSHTDYNGGMVLPVALPLGVHVAMAPREGSAIRIHSARFGETVTYRPGESPRGHWADYAAGAALLAQTHGLLAGGADLWIESTLPVGAGISSSAAVIVGVLKAARQIRGADLSDTEIAGLARQVENDYIGVPCGIMDQMAVAIGSVDRAMALDTETLEFDLIDLPAALRVCVIHSGIDRALADGRYKLRAIECAQARRAFADRPLCRLRRTDIEAAGDVAEISRRRARHCSTEHQRVVAAIGALKSGDLQDLGRLITASHASLRDDFDISLPPIDRLVADAVRLGAFGARLTGGGFGGCVVACIARDLFESWLTRLLAAHPAARLIC